MGQANPNPRFKTNSKTFGTLLPREVPLQLSAAVGNLWHLDSLRYSGLGFILGVYGCKMQLARPTLPLSHNIGARIQSPLRHPRPNPA